MRHDVRKLECLAGIEFGRQYERSFQHVLVEEAESLRGHTALIALAAQGLLHVEQIFFDVWLLQLAQGQLWKILRQKPHFALIAADGSW